MPSKKHLAGKHDLSHDYFDRLVNKQPVLKNAVANFLGEKDSDYDKKDKNIFSELAVDDSEKTDTISTIRARTNKHTGLIVFLFIFTIIAIESTNKEKSVSPSTSSSVSKGYTEAFLIVMNEKYGNVCKIETSGIFSRTLKVDWTKNTNKLYMIKVFAEIGEAKNRLYEEGVRYFQFPNNLCRYNVIEWKTGEKESISDRAPYFFTD